MFQVTTEKDDSETYLHEILETSTKKIKCKLCEKTYKILPSFHLHVKKKHADKHLCRVCYKVHDSEKEQISHEKKFHSKQFSCNYCNKKCWDYLGLKQHIKCIHPGKKPPPASDFDTPTAETAVPTTLTTIPTIRHELFETRPSSNVQKKHDGKAVFIHEYIDGKLLKCKLCDDIFNSNKEFNKHAKVQHEMKYLCFNCSEVFQDKKLRGRHINKHHTRYCNFCDKIFNVEASLEKHIQEIHLNSQNDEKEEVLPRLYSEDDFNDFEDFYDFEDLVDKDDKLREINHKENFLDDESFQGTKCKYDGKAKFIHEFIDGKILKCKLCDNIFNSNKEFNKHAKVQHEMKYLCFNCSEVFQDKKLRGRHINKHHTKYCNFCNKIFNVEASLEKHVQEVHLNNSQNDDDLSNIKYNKVLRLYSEDIFKIEDFDDPEEDNHKEDAFFLHETFQDKFGDTIMKCKECEKTFKSYTRLRYHAKEKHQYEWLCLVCCQVFPSGRYRGIHMRQSHTKDFSCTLCSKKCYDLTGLREHFRAKHPDEKFPRILPQNGTTKVESYQSPSEKNLPRQFKCKYCSQIFSQKGLRKKHVKQDHVYTCQDCGKKLHTEEGLINHCKAKNHQMEQEEKIIYQAIFQSPQSREVHSLQEENLSLRSGSDVSSEEECVKQNVREDDEMDDIENESGNNDSFNDDDDTGDESDDDRIRFPKCEECQLYFRDIKYLEFHNKFAH